MVKLVMPKYDSIGANYNETRKADPNITERLYTLLEAKEHGKYLDIGCGTGNYTHELHKKGLEIIGIDPSQKMLNQAKATNNKINWRLASAENTNLETSSLDGIIATLTIHHWNSLNLGFKEVSRVLKPERRLVLFTSTPMQMEGYWLNHYFPQMLTSSIDQMPSLSQIKSSMKKNGLSIEILEKYFVSPELADYFLYSGKHRPNLYLDKKVRNGISSFSALSNQCEVTTGLNTLKQDIETNQIKSITKSYENNEGDYLFIVAKKSA